MAKLHKVQIYLLDYNDDFNRASDLACYIDRHSRYGSVKYIEVSTEDLGEFYDEHPLNCIDCPKSEYEKYFKEN
jgi:hypothetical protein